MIDLRRPKDVKTVSQNGITLCVFLLRCTLKIYLSVHAESLCNDVSKYCPLVEDAHHEKCQDLITSLKAIHDCSFIYSICTCFCTITCNKLGTDMGLIKSQHSSLDGVQGQTSMGGHIE